MKWLFAPAVALMNRMGYARKFALVGAVSLMAIAVVGGSLHYALDLSVRQSQRELAGIGLIWPLSRVTREVQRHRGLSVMFLSGHRDEAVRQKCGNLVREIDAAFAALEARFSSGFRNGEAVRSIRADWARLREGWLGLTAEASFDAHTRLIARILAFEVDIADEYALTLDPEGASYYLLDTAVNKLPHAVEHLGQLRAYGAGVLAGKRLSGEQRIRLRVLAAELDDALAALKSDLDKIGRYNPGMRGSVSAISLDIADSAQRVSDLVALDILSGRFATDPENFFSLATASIDRIYAQLHDSVVPMAGTLVEARLAGARSRLYKGVGVALALFIGVAWLMGGIYLAIAGNVRKLVQSAHAFAGGDLDERVRLDAHDELRRVGESFNEMAYGFALLLRAQKDLSARLEEHVAERTRELELARRQLEEIAFHDPLTGLPNRRLLMERLGTALLVSARRGGHGAVMFIDLDRFKLLNDTLGHECGDLMLQEVARRLKSVVRETDTVARLGGDEFIVLTEDIGAERKEAARSAGLVAEKIREALARPYLLDGHEHRSSLSIGVCLFLGSGEPAEALLQHADRAMYEAKGAGRNTVRFCEPAGGAPTGA